MGRISRADMLIYLFSGIIFYSCVKEDVPTVETSEITEITDNSAVSGGIVTSEGSSSAISRGICWSTQTMPTISDNVISGGSGTGSFVSVITGLQPNSFYSVRAYATNSAGTGYGDLMTFSTNGQSPSVTTGGVTNLDITTVTLNGSVNANFLSTVVTFDYGITSNYDNFIRGFTGYCDRK